jgi:DNA-binding SARP family transcriptional activator
MADSVEFGVLGPLLVRMNGEVVLIPRGKQRTLLAMLLLRAGQIVPGDQLADMLWGPEPPPSAVVTLQNYVKRLRQAVGPAGRERIVTQPGGYLIQVEIGELDLAVMEQALTAARHAVRDRAWSRAAGEAAAALALWRGEPLGDVDLPPLAAAQVSRMAELRLQAYELRIEADLQLARHAEVITELQELGAAYPLRERLHTQLMLALYRSGRRAEALETYQRARDVLVEELGSEPGPELQGLQRQILRDDPALAPTLAAQVGPAGASAPDAIRQLPAAVSPFTGREAELAALNSLVVPEPGAQALALVISAIGGTAGVGKTALAVHWAYQIAERFPDGQLYVNLRGYDPDQPVLAADALAGFLRALGVAGQEIPDGSEERAALYRSKLAGRQFLVVLDNARDGEQVRPLLPGERGCIALVTSRDALAGLVAADGARRLDLDVLPLADAIELLRSLVGPRAKEDLPALAELAGLCARLPLALRIAAEMTAARPAATLRELVAELAVSRLDMLDAGEDRADIRAVFSWSHRQLPDDVADAFALIGLHPGADFDLYAAAALIDTEAARTRRVLDRLHRSGLLQAVGPGRYGLHDLLRAYAREQASTRDTGGQRRQALTRLFDYYLAAAAAAMNVVFPAEAHLRPRISPSVAVLPEMPGEAEALAWLDSELANLAAIVAQCAGQEWPSHATDIARTLFRYLIQGSHLPEARTIYGHALQAARRSGDVAAEADALNGLGSMAVMKGDSRDAAGYYRAALECYQRCGDRTGEARLLHNLGVTELQLHNHHSAADYYGRAIAVHEDARDSHGAARAKVYLAYVETEVGSYEQAAEHLRDALPVLRAAKDQLYEAAALERIGELNLRQGEYRQAADHFEQALDINRRVDNKNGVAAGLLSLGKVSLRRGRYLQASSYLRQALILCEEIGQVHGQIWTLRSLAEALDGAGDPAAARAELVTALRLAIETGNTYEQASTHRDLAESHYSSDDNEQARDHWQQALTLYTQLGVPEAEQVQSRLSQL